MILAYSISVALQVMGLAGSLVLLLAPIRRGELVWWRTLRLGGLRKVLTRRLRQPEPYDRVATIRISRRNIGWHIVLTTVLLTLGLGAKSAITDWRWWIGMTSFVPACAWLVGSLVQRHKWALAALRGLSEKREPN